MIDRAAFCERMLLRKQASLGGAFYDAVGKLVSKAGTGFNNRFGNFIGTHFANNNFLNTVGTRVTNYGNRLSRKGVLLSKFKNNMAAPASKAALPAGGSSPNLPAVRERQVITPEIVDSPSYAPTYTANVPAVVNNAAPAAAKSGLSRQDIAKIGIGGSLGTAAAIGCCAGEMDG